MTCVMSFWPSVFENISNQTKIIEYRRSFPKNCQFAYMYVSKPVKSICGIVYFGNKHSLSDWRNEYSNYPKIINRIDSYLEKYKYGTEILAFQKIRPITLEELRNNVPGFVAPQSYFLLQNNRELKNYIEKNLVLIGNKINNDLTNIYPEHICKTY